MATHEANIFTIKANKFKRELVPEVNRLQAALANSEIVDVFRALIDLNRVARPLMDELKQAVEMIPDE